MRRYGEPGLPDQAYRDRMGAYAVLLSGRDVLLTEQKATEIEIQLPGGGIDPGETPLRALHREVFEETGYRICNPRRIGAYQRYTYMPEYDLWARKVCHIYLARPALRISEPPDREHRVIWSDSATAPGLLSNTGDRDFLLSVLRWRGLAV